MKMQVQLIFMNLMKGQLAAFKVNSADRFVAFLLSFLN